MLTTQLTVRDLGSRALCWLPLVTLAILPSGVRAADCNDNGVEDALDIAGYVSADCNGNGIPDECDLRGRLALAGARSYVVAEDSSVLAVGDIDGHEGPEGPEGPEFVHFAPRGRGAEMTAFGFTPSGRLEPIADSLGLAEPVTAAAVADANGDGRTDVVVVGRADDGFVSVILQSETGSFATVVTTIVPFWSTTIAVTDLNADGVPDAVVGGSGRELDVLVLIGSGDGSFTLGTHVHDELANDVSRIEFADFDRDGDLDIFAGADGHASLTLILHNDGEGVFEEVTRVNHPGPAGALIAVGDFDGDDWPDTIGSGSEDRVSRLYLFRNLQDGSFEPTEISKPADEVRLELGFAVDVDNDEDLDVVFGEFASSPNERRSVATLINSGTGEFTLLRSGSIASAPRLATDVDGDGAVDVVAAAFGAIEILPGDGSGEFPSAPAVGIPDVASDIVLGPSPALDSPRRLVVAAERYAITLEVTPDGGLRTLGESRIGDDIWGIDVGDIDEDGTLDIVMGTSDGLFYLPATGGAAAEMQPIVTDEAVVALDLADLDGDGHLDIVFAADVSQSRPEELHTLFGRGDGTFQTGGEPVPAFETLRELQVFDYDGNGVLDLAANGLHTFGVFSPGAAASWRLVVQVDLEAHPSWLTPGDFDGDGHTDVALMGEGELMVFLQRGGALVLSSAQTPPGDSAFALGTADIDRDGTLDLVLTSSQGVLFYRGTGDGEFEFVAARASGTGTGPLATGDVDGDGDPDVVSGAVFSETVHFLANQSEPPASVDDDGDGRPDECPEGPFFHRGDYDDSGTLNVGDPIGILLTLFVTREIPPCVEAGDADNDGATTATDVLLILNYLFARGDPPAPPGPTVEPCGLDPDPAGSAGDLGCVRYTSC